MNDSLCEKICHCCSKLEATFTQTGGQSFQASFKHECVAPFVVCLWTLNVTIFSCLLSQEAPVTDPDTNKSPSHPIAKTSTQVPRPEVHAQLCFAACVCVYA